MVDADSHREDTLGPYVSSPVSVVPNKPCDGIFLVPTNTRDNLANIIFLNLFYH